MSASAKNGSKPSNQDGQIAHVLNKDKKYLSEHGQKLFNAINCLLDDNEQLQLTQALFKYQKDHNVFTLVRSCRELFDTSRKKSLMLFMRPVIPVKDRFHYDEYYKLFFPEEFSTGVKSIFADLIPKELLEKTIKKADEKKKQNLEKENEQKLAVIKQLEKTNQDLNIDIQKLMAEASLENSTPSTSSIKENTTQDNVIKIAGYRIIDLEPKEDESLGFDVCMGPTGTFIMISYVEPNSMVDKLGMKIGDELVSVNEISFKMIELEQAIDILSTEPTLRIVLQTSGFMPELETSENLDSDSVESQTKSKGVNFEFKNEWNNSFGKRTTPPSESKTSLKRHIRRVILRPRSNEENLGFKIRGGIENGLGIFVSFVEPKSTADLVGLKVCDQIIEVNGQTFSRITHEDAVLILKSSLINYKSNKLPIKITVRYLSKLPLLNVIRSNKDSVTSIDKEFDYDTGITLNDDYVKENLNKLKILKFDSSIFSSIELFKLFKYYLGEYVKKKISIQYYVYLISNRVKINKESLLNSEELSNFIYNDDFHYYRQMLQFKINNNNNRNSNHENVRYLKNDFKNSLIVRSTEVVNDLNINHIKKINKYDNFDNDKLFSNKKLICKSMDCLNQLVI